MLGLFKNTITPIRFKECYDAYCGERKSNSRSKSFYCDTQEYRINFLVNLFAFSYKYAVGFGVFLDNLINRHSHFNYNSFILEVIVRVIITVIISLLIEAISIRMFIRTAYK
ncbi:MAG: hypothetical protein VB009_08460 [Erysipelotrichaceae bacterium]|nr:hypothetical protein [Erysipelotrichaceae bacterium]